MNPRDQALEKAAEVLASRGWAKAGEHHGSYPFACGKKGTRINATLQWEGDQWRVTVSIGAHEIAVKIGSDPTTLLTQAEATARSILIDNANLLHA